MYWGLPEPVKTVGSGMSDWKFLEKDAPVILGRQAKISEKGKKIMGEGAGASQGRKLLS